MKLKDLLFKNKKAGFLYFVGVLLSGSTNIFVSIAMANAVKLFGTDNSMWLRIGLTSFGFMMIPVVSQVISRFLRIGLMTDVLKDVRLLAYDKIMSMTNEDFNKEEKDSYQSALISDINLFEKDFFLSLLNISFSFINNTIYLVILFSLSWEVALTSLITALLLLMISKLFEKKTREKRKQSLDQNKVYTNSVTNLVDGASTIKHYSKEMRFINRFLDDTEKLELIKTDYYGYNLAQSLTSEGINFSSQMLMLIYAAYLMSITRIDFSQFILIINLSGGIVWSMVSGISHLNKLKSSFDIYYRIVDFDSKPVATLQAPSTPKIEASNLNFSYDDKVQIIKDLDININNKDKVLIHGESGTGKTTLLNLLSQNLSQYDGNIYLDDKKLNEVNHESFLSISSYMRQTHFMFDDSVRNNIILDRDFDPVKYEDVLRKAALYDWIFDKDDMELVENGSNISGGQRQRISFARELYGDFDVLFIDEPSAALDDENAEILYDTIINLDKTVICVSHRHLDYLSEHFDTVYEFKEAGA